MGELDPRVVAMSVAQRSVEMGVQAVEEIERRHRLAGMCRSHSHVCNAGAS